MRSASTRGEKTLRTLCALLLIITLLPTGAMRAYAQDAEMASEIIGQETVVEARESGLAPGSQMATVPQPVPASELAPQPALPSGPDPESTPTTEAATSGSTSSPASASSSASGSTFGTESASGSEPSASSVPKEAADSTTLTFARVTDKQFAALGGEEEFLKEFKAYLEKKHPAGTFVAALETFDTTEEGVNAVFEMDDAKRSLIKVGYTPQTKTYAFEKLDRDAEGEELSLSDEETIAEGEQLDGAKDAEEASDADSADDAHDANESEDARIDQKPESTNDAETPEDADSMEDPDDADESEEAFVDQGPQGNPLAFLSESIVPLASPPQSIVGRFTLDDWFYSNSSQANVAFPGWLSINGYEVVSYGSNQDANNRRFYCISPGAANWGDTANANNRSGTVYATWQYDDVNAGVSWYQVNYIIPDIQPAAPGNIYGVQYLGQGRIAIRQSFKGELLVGKIMYTNPATLPDDVYSLAGTTFILSRSSVRPADFNDANAVATFKFASNPTDGQWGTYSNYWYVRPLVSAVKSGFGGVGTDRLTGVDPGTYYLHEYMNPAWGMSSGAAWKDQSYTHAAVKVPAGGSAIVDFVNQPKGVLEIYKATADSVLTSDNARYSLAGAHYGVYATNADAVADTNRVSVLTTDESGYAKSDYLDQGSYHVKEITASPGYLRDPQVYSVTLNSVILAARVDSREVPAGDSVVMVVQKFDATTGEAWGKDDPEGASLAGARFTVRYYDGSYTTAAEAEKSGAPTRTWIVETKKGGLARLQSDYLVAGSDKLYYNSQGDATLPLGTLLIQETKAPDAYLLPAPNPVSIMRLYLDDGVFKRSIVTDGVTTDYVERLNTLRVKEQPRRLIVCKRDAADGGLLAGAEFTLYRESVKGKGDWKEVARRTTDATGYAEYNPIAIGSYKLVETKAPDGYLLPSETGMSDARVFVLDETSTDSVIEFTFEDHKRPASEVIKLDASSGEPLGGARFALYSHPVTLKDGLVATNTSAIAANSSGWAEVARVTTDGSGKATFGELPFGYYKLVELSAPAGYLLPSEAGFADEHFFVLDGSSGSLLTLRFEDYKKPAPELLKLDAKTGEPLGGAQFALYSHPVKLKDGFIATNISTITSNSIAWTEVIRLTTDDTGKAMLPKLPFGYYRLIELAAPEGYLLPSEAGFADEHFFILDASTESPLTLTFEDYKKPISEVIKLDAKTGEPLGGAEFALYSYPVELQDGSLTSDVSAVLADDPGWAEVATATTDGTGKANFGELLFGYYKLVEIKAPAGYLLPSEAGFADERFFTLDALTESPLVLMFEDYKKPVSEALKVDAKTSEPLGGAEFVLYSYPVKLQDGSVASDVSSIVADDSGWAEIARVITGTKGKATFGELPFGYYKLVEIKAPEGYLLPSEAGMSDEHFFILDASTESPLTLTFEDYKKLAPEVLKLDAKTSEPLGGAEFTLYSYPVKLQDGSLASDVSDIPVDDPAWAEVTNAITDDTGKASFGELPFGYYKLVETKAPEGYLLPSEAGFTDEHFFILDASTELPLVLTFEDYKKPVSEAFKVDAKTSEPLGGAEFALYSYPVKLQDGSLASDVSAVLADDPGWAEVAHLTTDDTGKASFGELPFGYYKLVETKAPGGYLLPSEAGFTDEHFFILDASTESPLVLTFKDHESVTPEVLKLSRDADEPLADTEFTLYRYPVEVKDGCIITDVSAITADDQAWAEVASVTTDDTGKAVFEDLPFGYYQIKETRPNPLYASSEESGDEGARLFVIDVNWTSEVQVFYNEKIHLSCEIYEDTINVTSAGFRTDDEDYLRVENVGAESYHYTLDFRSTSNVRADEFTVVDALESVATGNVRLVELFTPVAQGDTDGLFNLWYRTNLTDTSQVYSSANAMDSNPFNPNNPTGTQLWPSVGWRLWQANLSSIATTRLSVSGLGLAPDEYITALRFEYGSVEVGFTTRDTCKQALQVSKDSKSTLSDWAVNQERAGGQDVQSQTIVGASIPMPAGALKPATYLVTCSTALLPPTTIRDSAVVNIARNAVLSDVDRDTVKTTVIEPFMVKTEPTSPTDLVTLVEFGKPRAGELPATGDRGMLIGVAAITVLLILASVFLSRRRVSKNHSTEPEYFSG
jgi:LPXTG-motif cell wall-anchored protein